MRSEEEMYQLILGTAEEDERIRAVYMNGSRTNPNVPKDLLQDYDIVYVVKETGTFQKDRAWIDRFGKRLFMQYPEESVNHTYDKENCYGWLMQFEDGNRLDLHVCTLPEVLRTIQTDRLCKILLDKDHCLPGMPESTDADHWVKKPSEAEFHETCNEFWWCLDNVAKGLWRAEIPYVMDMIHGNVRPMLLRILSWKAGLLTDFTVSARKSGKYLYRWLEEDVWKTFIKTYESGTVEVIWDSVFSMCGLFARMARETAKGLGYGYKEEEEAGSLLHLNRVKEGLL